MTLHRFHITSLVFVLFGANLAFADFKTDAQVATARADLASTLKAIVARVFAENIDTKIQKAPNNKEWGEWIIETANLNKKRWTSLGGNGIYPVAENTICQVDGDTPLLWINIKTGDMHFNPSKLLDSKGFCGKLRDSYADKSKNANGDKIIPLISNGTVDFKNSANSINNEEFVNVAIQGNLGKIKMLIKNGANIDVIDNRGLTALVGASTNGKLEVVKYLISQGADINIRTKAKNNNDFTALIMASGGGHLEVVKFLVANGANVNDKTKGGGTALMAASANGHLSVIKFLISKGANINAKTNDGGTALIMASAYGHIEVMNYLIENGADVSAKDDSGKTALEYLNKYKKK